MIRDLFRTAGDIAIYGMISTVIFLVFFVLLAIRAVAMRREEADEFGRMPLDDSMQKSDDIHDI